MCEAEEGRYIRCLCTGLLPHLSVGADDPIQEPGELAWDWRPILQCFCRYKAFDHRIGALPLEI